MEPNAIKSYHFPVTEEDISDMLFRIMGTPHKECETMRVHVELLNGLYESIKAIVNGVKPCTE
jgi:hypothetical protein